MLHYDILTSSADEQSAIDNINAIYEYVRERRKDAERYPAVLPLIESFEAWYGMLEEQHESLFEHLVTPIGMTEVNEAKRRRSEIQQAVGDVLPPDYVPADGGQTPPDAPPENNVLPIAVGAAGLGLGAWLVYKLFGGRR